MKGKLGWIIFLTGFILAVISSISRPGDYGAETQLGGVKSLAKLKGRLLIKDSAQFTKEDIPDLIIVAQKLTEQQYIFQILSAEARACIAGPVGDPTEERSREILADGFNKILQMEDFYQSSKFEKIKLSQDSKSYIARLQLYQSKIEKLKDKKESLSEYGKKMEEQQQVLANSKSSEKEKRQALAQMITQTENTIIDLEKTSQQIKNCQSQISEITPFLNRLLLEDALGNSVKTIACIQAWILLAFGVLLGLIGVVLIHVDYRETLTGSGAGSSTLNEVDPKEGISNIIALLKKIDMEASAEKIQKDLEQIQLYHIFPLAEYRATLAHKMGLEKFAAMFSEFSTGERYVNRAWSAIVDGHLPECRNSVETAVEYFQTALENL